MQFISAHNGKIQTLSAAAVGMDGSAPLRGFKTSLEALDALAPKQSFARGAVHELLFQRSDGSPNFVAALIAQAAAGDVFLPLPPGEGWGEGTSGVESVSHAKRPLTLTLSRRERGPE